MVDYRLSEQLTASVHLVLGKVTTKIWVVLEIITLFIARAYLVTGRAVPFY
jgi:hypothetical protein